MADAITDTEQVKAVVQGVLAWMPVISTLAGGVLTDSVDLLVSRGNHRFTHANVKRLLLQNACDMNSNWLRTNGRRSFYTILYCSTRGASSSR